MVKFLKKPMSVVAFRVLCFSLFFVYMFSRVLMPYDSDLPFLVATGRDIIQNGISDKNAFIIDGDIHFVIQQWLYTVILAFVDSLGPVGMSLFLALQLFLLGFLSWEIMKKYHIGKGIFLLAFFFICMFNGYFSNLRPQNITLILLLAECLALDRYRDTGKWQWLLLLPFTMILEMNLHMSMWIIHYAILLAYMVPGFYYKKLIKNDLISKWKLVGLFTLLMTACLFLNPYGFDGIMFSINSMTSGMKKYVMISEHMPADILSSSGAAIILIAIILVVLLVNGRVSSVTLHLSLGFSFMTALQLHNSMFLSISLIFVICDIAQFIIDKNIVIDWRKDLCNYLYFMLIGGLIVTGIISLVTVDHVISLNYDYLMACEDDGLYAATAYLDANASKDSHIYAGYSLGNYLEYRGYNKIFIDARPESYTKKLNGSKDILNYYGTYGMWGLNLDDISDIVVKADVDTWLDMYDFDYFLFAVDGRTESPFLRGYIMQADDEYERVDYSEYMYDTDGMSQGILLVEVYRKIK